MNINAKLKSLKLMGALGYFESEYPKIDPHGKFAECIHEMLDAEVRWRTNAKYTSRLRNANLRHVNASPSDIKYSEARNLKEEKIKYYLESEWIESGERLFITGSTGVGKTWLACALARQACMNEFSCRFVRFQDLFSDFELHRSRNSLKKALKKLSSYDLVIFDDFGIIDIDPRQKNDLLEFIECRHDRSIIITAQLPPDRWLNYLQASTPTIANAVMDRLTENSRSLEIKGASMRKRSK